MQTSPNSPEYQRGRWERADPSGRERDASDGTDERDESRAFATKLLGPLRVPCKILLTDSRPRVLNRLDEVLQHEWGLQKLFCFDAEPSHLSCAGIAWRAWSKLLDTLDNNL